MPPNFTSSTLPDLQRLRSGYLAERKMKIPKKRPPSHPAEVLLKHFLEPMGISQREVADNKA
jgi:hypothetical protein